MLQKGHQKKKSLGGEKGEKKPFSLKVNWVEGELSSHVVFLWKQHSLKDVERAVHRMARAGLQCRDMVPPEMALSFPGLGQCPYQAGAEGSVQACGQHTRSPAFTRYKEGRLDTYPQGTFALVDERGPTGSQREMNQRPLVCWWCWLCWWWVLRAGGVDCDWECCTEPWEKPDLFGAFALVSYHVHRLWF